eukprot:CAMPEP_0204433998 /NCGR_PEP_ID=MMETSP0470-20130426/70674_1 /ASSEMBLY_ACC=CAM_ASM_000385 /TAXON_ID=2969 /ORGANISM="Oxyrrhis marina" /LENGTH=30 /DNA_ID= /DNA_START= /DNA_END= /DNA_ORIENTATION=
MRAIFIPAPALFVAASNLTSSALTASSAAA